MTSIISTDLKKAKQVLENDGIIAVPTETVYGLAGNIFSEKAIKSIFETKQRPFFNPLIVHIPSIDVLETLVEEIPDKAKLLAEAFWPGPLTLILKKKPHIPDLITAGKNTVAIRIPNHPIALELLNQLDFPLAAPSANPFNRISPTTAKHVEEYFNNKIEMILDGGDCKKGIESTIIGFDSNRPSILRLGSTSIEAIESIIGPVSIKNYSEQQPLAPGMLKRHYAPKTKIIITDNLEESISRNPGLVIGILSFDKTIESKFVKTQILLSATSDLDEAASNLYGALHELDQQNLDLIIAKCMPDIGLGRSINDRLDRATKS